MKKRILLLSIVLVSFTAFSFAADAPAISKNVDQLIQQTIFQCTGYQMGTPGKFCKGRVYHE